MWRRRPRLVGALALVSVVVLALSALSVAGAVTLPLLPGAGTGGGNGLNDLGALGQGFGQTPAKATVQQHSEPPLTATALAPCGPGSRPEPDVDGRVPQGTGDNGLWCNMALIAHQGTSGGFKTFRYVDSQGHVCAFYDTALLFPTNAINAAGPSLGVAVLDMSDPSHPVQTDTLSAPSMLTPHESLNLNTRRGLLAAVDGNPATSPGVVSIYDVHADCRHPVLDSASFVARLGHESGFSPDGNTFYATATAAPGITAIDVSDPTHPHAIWQGNVQAHGMTLSDDGNRAYIADPTGGDLLILDTSQIQARVTNPQAREISRLTWKSVSIPQNAIPFTENGHPYLLEFDEYTAGTLNPAGSRDVVGAARIIDISNEAAPFVVSNLRLQVDQPAEHHAAGNDPGTMSAAQGYAAHYCNIPSRVDPKIVACSFIASGLRVFDISDLVHPRELGYFVSPTTPNTETGYTESDYAMSQPTFDVARHEIWYTDGGTGFYVLQVTNGMWPGSASMPAPGAGSKSTTKPATSAPTCPGTIAVRGRSLGPVHLGMSRAQVRRALRAGGACPIAAGIRVVYPSKRVLRSLSRAARAHARNRVAAAVTGSSAYSLHGVRPGTRFAGVARRLHLGRAIVARGNRWYRVGAGSGRGLIEVRHGVVKAVGIASRALTRSRIATARLLASL